MSKHIVTGGAGFMGSNLVHDLVKKGHDVIVVDPIYARSRELTNESSMEFCHMVFHEFYRTGNGRTLVGCTTLVNHLLPQCTWKAWSGRLKASL